MYVYVYIIYDIIIYKRIYLLIYIDLYRASVGK